MALRVLVLFAAALCCVFALAFVALVAGFVAAAAAVVVVGRRRGGIVFEVLLIGVKAG